MSENKPVHSDVDYERTDVDIRPLVNYTVALTVVLVVVGVLMVGMIKLFMRGDPVSPFAVSEEARPQEPRVDTFNGLLEKARDEEKELLAAYDWVDKKSGVVRIPITRAMEILAQRGLPARREQNAQR